MKVVVIILLVLLLVWILNSFIIQVSEIPNFIIDNFRSEFVLLFFLLSESILGLIPPDFFILWISEMESFYLWVGLLGILSYFGGINAYAIGWGISKIPRVRKRIENLYSNHISKIKKWGVVFIAIAALFPLPYATVCSLAGILNFPVSRLSYIGLLRVIRFYLYAPIVLGVI